MPAKRKPEVVFLEGFDEPKPGDPAPSGYAHWHAWAEVQTKAGIHQRQCPGCGLWLFPQEFKSHDNIGCE